MLSLMRWIMEGNRGLLYVRVMRTPSAVLYDSDYAFEFGSGHVLRELPSERGGHRQQRPRRARSAGGRRLPVRAMGIDVGVVDMPSIDEVAAGPAVRIGQARLPRRAEQRLSAAEPLKRLASRRREAAAWDRILAINTLDADGRPQFIHSGTYEELTEAFGLSASQHRRTRSAVALERTAR